MLKINDNAVIAVCVVAICAVPITALIAAGARDKDAYQQRLMYEDYIDACVEQGVTPEPPHLWMEENNEQ